jgi:3-methyladenine DNA glycosylase AlkD
MLDKNASVQDIIHHLRTMTSQDAIDGMRRFAIVTDTALGISNPDLQKLARQVGNNHQRALQLWASDIREARLMAIYTADPALLTQNECLAWTADFNSWEIVDAAADLFTQTPFWKALIDTFSADNREFVRRTAFAMIAGATVHLKKAPDQTMIGFLPLIRTHAADDRNFVFKAVNWALRNIGKRSNICHAPALALAQVLADSENKTERWVGKDAVKQLTGEKLLARLK